MKTTWIFKKRKKINVRAVRRPFLQLGICFGSQLKKQEQHRSNGTNSLHETHEMKYVIKTINKFPFRTQKLYRNERKPWQAARRTTRFEVLRLVLDECKWTKFFPKNSQTRHNNFEFQNMNLSIHLLFIQWQLQQNRTLQQLFTTKTEHTNKFQV